MRILEAIKCLLVMTNIDPKHLNGTYNKARLDLVIR